MKKRNSLQEGGVRLRSGLLQLTQIKNQINTWKGTRFRFHCRHGSLPLVATCCDAVITEKKEL